MIASVWFSTLSMSIVNMSWTLRFAALGGCVCGTVWKVDPLPTFSVCRQKRPFFQCDYPRSFECVAVNLRSSYCIAALRRYDLLDLPGLMLQNSFFFPLSTNLLMMLL